MNDTSQPSNFGIYIHWPFCLSKCPYCDFNSHVRHAAIDEARFVRAFGAEIAATAARVPGRNVSSIFFGGGTPSLMQPETVGAILDAVGRHWSVAPDAEVTLEANPTSVEATRFRGYRAAGVNRVSLGVQALDDAALKELGRLHTAQEALDAVGVARSIFERYSFDLIYARPRQTPEAWAAELKRAIAEAAEHLSLYQLTIEHDTPFAALRAAGKLVIPDEDSARTLYDTTQDICAGAGLPAYEVSNHARPGAECRHNLVYWRAHEYAGIGPGAHGRLDIDGERHAIATEKRPEAWLMRVETLRPRRHHRRVLTREETADEFLLMGLRLAEGIDPRPLRAPRRPPARSAPPRHPARGRRGGNDRRRHAARHGRRFPGARCGGGRSGGVTIAVSWRSAYVPEPANDFGGGLMTWPPVGDTRSTARPRWLVPSGRKRNSPSMPVKPDALVSACLGEALRALRLGERRDQRDRVIGERRGAHRVLAVAGAVARREIAEAGGVRPGIPGAFERRIGEDLRILPQSAAEELHPLGIDAARPSAPAPPSPTASAPSGMKIASARPPACATLRTGPAASAPGRADSARARPRGRRGARPICLNAASTTVP